MGFRDNIAGNSNVEESRRTSHWQLDSTTASESSELNISDTKYYSPNGLDLYVVQKKERSSSRPIIPATKCEKLTYIRSYVSHSKTEALGVRFIDYNAFFWYYLQGAFLKTLPSCYVYLFLGSYAAQHHLFLTKMAPLLQGINIVWILIGVIQLYFATYMQVMSLDFIFVGIMNHRPWNRCFYNYYTRPLGKGFVNVSCLTLDQFTKKTKNGTFTMSNHYFYEPATKEFFQISHFFNANMRSTLWKSIFRNIDGFFIYYNIIWISSSLLINQIFKRTLWKILHVAHWMLAVFYACVLLFLIYFAATYVDLSTVTLQSSKVLEKHMGLDLEFIAESMTAPPILHILTSRSKGEVKLSTASAIIVTSNTIFYLFRGYVRDRLLRYCVYITNAQWHLVYWQSNCFFLWPIFFSSVRLDGIITIPFSILIFVVDYVTFVITHHFLIEVIVCEWDIFKRWHAALMLFVLANLYHEQWFNVINWLILFGIRAATSTELLIITFLYPLSRFLEDVTFHNGIAPSFVAVLGLRLVFIFYFIKFIYWTSIYGHNFKLPMQYEQLIGFSLLLVMLVALLIKLYDIVIVKKKNWKLIFVPIVNWGPFDMALRLLRKKFDSTKYIASQAPRELSRYLIQKAEPKSYKLDVRYDSQRKLML